MIKFNPLSVQSVTFSLYFIDDVVEYNNEKIYVKPNKEELVFTVESWGQISPKEIMLKAIEALKKNLKQIK